ncbi:hypothetical protein [Larkinella arboricola]|uniref:hypothetical protein n=1 Tax=Larkinella arboricola TaxID=643671 RepID=UPI0014751227|nr:hypothetical protein [Larkinella arboricola]
MKKVKIKLSNDEYEIIKSCLKPQHKFDSVFHSQNVLYQKNGVELSIPIGQLDSFMSELIKALRAKGTINSIYTDFGRKVDSIIDRLSTEFYG